MHVFFVDSIYLTKAVLQKIESIMNDYTHMYCNYYDICSCDVLGKRLLVVYWSVCVMMGNTRPLLTYCVFIDIIKSILYPFCTDRHGCNGRYNCSCHVQL